MALLISTTVPAQISGDLSAWNFTFLLISLGAFAAFYFGIFIRKVGFPSQDSPPLSRQLLIGTGVSIPIVVPLLQVITQSLRDPYATILAFGVVIEQGMMLTEYVTKKFPKPPQRGL